MIRQLTRLQKARAEYAPKLPSLLHDIRKVEFAKGRGTGSVADFEKIRTAFPLTFGRPVAMGQLAPSKEIGQRPLRVGVLLSGGQAPGGHNVITGLFDALHILSPESRLFGFLGGPIGIIEKKTLLLTKEIIAPFRNQGGFDLIGAGRTKIETEEQLEASLKTVQDLDLDGIVIIGGDDSNTNGATLAEYFLKKGCATTVVGVPKTIDGDLKNEHIGVSFGFDTATKTYSEMIGNLARDAISAKKYFHFVKLMGRSASHIALECALATHPNLAVIGEEVAQRKMTISSITAEIADLVQARSAAGKNYGVALIPEGLIEFIPEVQLLISELSALSASGEEFTPERVEKKLSPEAIACFRSLPKEIQRQFLLDRDPHGNVQVSMIETEKLLIETVKEELKTRGFKGKFSPISHFYGYEGRAGFPSNFDSNYCFALGYTAALLVRDKLTGYMTSIGNLSRPVQDWTISGIPITMMMNMEVRKGKEKPVIRKTLVDLKGKPFHFFKECRTKWAMEDEYRFPGPIQFYGETESVDAIPLSLQLELV